MKKKTQIQPKTTLNSLNQVSVFAGISDNISGVNNGKEAIM